jgi:dTDP-glucose 4,6-dehydratase
VLEASYAKVQSLTGWEPTWSGREGLLAGLSNTVDWFRDPEHLRRYKPHIYST